MKAWVQLSFYCRRAGIRAVFGLAAVQFLHSPGWAFAQADRLPASSEVPLCVLYVQDPKIENESSWRERGYRLVERRDLLSLPTREIGRLLDDTHFSLIRRSQKSEFWMSLSRGQVEEQWNPLIMQAPAVGQDVALGYGCSHLQERLDFFRETRRALINAMKLSVGRTSDQLRGEVILDLERSFFVHKGRYEYADTSAKERYRRILNEVRPLSAQTDFFQAWFEVRRRVYGPRGDVINYCGGVATMTEAMVKSCTNCVGETYLLMALFQDAGFRPPAGWELGVQFFNDHLRPVLYHPQNVKTFDLVSGAIGKVEAPVLGPEQIEIQLWLGQSALRPASEVKFMRSQTSRYLYRPANCHLKSTRREFQAAEWTQIENCGTFPGSAPAFASNASKVESVSSEESSENLAFSGAASASEEDTEMLFRALKYMRPTLNALESKLVQDILDGKQSPQTFLSQFSVRKLTSALGYSYLLQDPRSSLDPIWQSTYLPRPIREGTAAEAMSSLVSSSVHFTERTAGADYYTMRRTNLEGDALAITNQEIIVFDSKLWGQIKDRGLLDRHRIVYRWVVEVQQQLREKLEKNLLLSLETGPLLNELAQEDLSRSLVVYAHNQEAIKVWRDFFAFGVLNKDMRETPLARAFEGDLRVPSSAPFVRKLKQHLRTLSTHPVEVLRWLDSQEDSANDSLQRSLRGMGEMMVQISGADAEPPWVLRPNEDILYRVLTHPQYFFTVLDSKLQKQGHRGVPVADTRLQDIAVETPKGPVDQIQLPTWEGPSPCASGGTASVPDSSGYGIVVQCRPKERSRDASPTASKVSESNAELSESDDQDPRLEVHLKPSTWQWLLEGVRRSDTILMDSGVRILLHHVYRPALQEVYRRHRYARDWMSFDPSDLESAPVLYDSDRRDQDPQGTALLSLQKTSSASLYGSLAKASFFRVALKSLEHLKPGYVRFVPAVVQPRERDLEARLLGFLQLKDSAQVPSGLLIPMFVQDPSSRQVVFTSLSRRQSSYSIFKNSERLGLRQLYQHWLRYDKPLRGGGMGLNEVIGRRGVPDNNPVGITLRRFIYERQKIRWSIVGISADEPLSFNQLQSLADI